MAADAYLKVAASQMQQAATAVKQDADQIRGELATFKRTVEKEIGNMQSEVTIRQLEADRNKDDTANYNMLLAVVLTLKHKISDKQQELAQRTSEAEQKIRGKEGAVQGIISQAQGIQRQAGDPQLK